MDNLWLFITMSLLSIIVFFAGVIVGCEEAYKPIEVQDIKQVENGYYITVSNEIYYKEVEKDVKD